MNNDFSELIQYLDEKFEKVASKEATIDLSNRVISLEEKVKTLATKEDFNNLLTAIDAYAQKADTYFQEMVMLSHKVDRHETWLREIAEKLGIKLKY